MATPICAKCGNPIEGRAVFAVGLAYHPECFWPKGVPDSWAEPTPLEDKPAPEQQLPPLPDARYIGPAWHEDELRAYGEACYRAGMERAAVIAASMPACPFDGPTKLEPNDPCPVCGDRGDDPSAPSNCRSVAAAIRSQKEPT